LLVQQVVGLVDQADENIGHNIGRTSLDIGPIGLMGLGRDGLYKSVEAVTALWLMN
jgi:hypothetical protein